MRLSELIALTVLAVLNALSNASASVYLPYATKTRDAFSTVTSSSSLSLLHRQQKNYVTAIRLYRRRHHNAATAMAIPGYGVVEQVFVGGFANFLSIYNFIITARILLSWFPQAQGVAALQPVYAITDPYLNLFRGVLPSFGGLDFSPILAFFALNLLSSATAAVGCELPPGFVTNSKKSNMLPFPFCLRGQTWKPKNS